MTVRESIGRATAKQARIAAQPALKAAQANPTTAPPAWLSAATRAALNLAQAKRAASRATIDAAANAARDRVFQLTRGT
jgi:hypothetical protein